MRASGRSRRPASPAGARRSASTSAGATCRSSSRPIPACPAGPSSNGATSYHVWFVDVFPGKVVATKTNAVDHREFYAFHQQSSFSGTVRFRVRAVRNLYGSIPTGLPAVSHGPWSPVFTSANPAIAGGVVTPVAALSDSTTSTPTTAALHRLTPGFAFTGTTSAAGVAYDLYRVYVFSDRDCVNTIFRGAMVGSPAYVPRLTGPLKLPKSDLGSQPRTRRDPQRRQRASELHR